MYRFLLCWRYLLTRYLALACVVSVMLGVATLIVVNSVMAGFSTKLQNRLHGLLADMSVESFDQGGFYDPPGMMERIRRSSIGDDVEAMTPVIEILGLIQINYMGHRLSPRAVHLVGIDPVGRAKVGGFAQYLTDPNNRRNPTFKPSPAIQAEHDLKYPRLSVLPQLPAPEPGDRVAPVWPEQTVAPELPGAILGYAIANKRAPDATADSEEKDIAIVNKGEEITLYTISGVADRLTPVYSNVIVSDFFKSEMSEYDSNYVFVPLDWLQRMRTMENRATGIQIRLKDYSRAPAVVKELRRLFPLESVQTWEDKQGPLLSAIAIEKGILNVLLFLIVGVAGFGILSIFAMIVVEKTRDIGILKALGASDLGILNIFLGYGLLLGLVGATLGTALGLALTIKINEVEHLLTRLTGHEVFNRSVYYFDSIPTDIQGRTVVLVNIGAIIIAVAFSLLPALRAARLHPVRALRYE